MTAKPSPDALVEDVYAELRRLAGRYVHRERVKSVQATELVHEAYLRLAQDKPVAYADRAHFVGIAAIAMRRLLMLVRCGGGCRRMIAMRRRRRRF